MSAFTALFDANVLYAVPVTDIVMELHRSPAFLADTETALARWQDYKLRKAGGEQHGSDPLV